MREMKDSGVPWIGEIPIDWKLLRNKNAFLCSKEIVGNKSATTRLLSLTTKGIKEKGPDVVGGKVPESFDTYQTVRKGQLVMCLFDLDCSAVFSGLSPLDGMISPAYKVVDCKEGMNTSFASYWFSSVFDGRKFMHYSKNLRYTLTYDEFAVLPIVIPPLCEQQSIAKYLDSKCTEIDSILENTRASIEEYKKLKQSVITEAVTKGIRGERPMKDSGVEWIGEIPADWDVMKIKWLLKERNDRSEEGYEEPLSMSQKFGIIPTKDMDVVPNMASSFVGAKLVYRGDLVFNKLKAHLGVFAVSEYEGLVSPDYAVYYSAGRCDVKYLERIFKTPQYISEFRKRSTGVGAGLTRLYTSDLFDMYTALPSETEQQEIAAYLDEKCTAIDSLIVSKEALIAELEAYKKSIIYEYVTGKKEVK